MKVLHFNSEFQVLTFDLAGNSTYLIYGIKLLESRLTTFVHAPFLSLRGSLILSKFDQRVIT